VARQYTRLADIQYVPATVGAIYTNPASTKTYITGFVIFNGNSTAELVKLYNVPNSGASAGTAGAANQFYEKSVASKATEIINLPYPITLLDLNDTIQADTDTASFVTIQLLGDIDA
jgi:hypothetical protein